MTTKDRLEQEERLTRAYECLLERLRKKDPVRMKRVEDKLKEFGL